MFSCAMLLLIPSISGIETSLVREEIEEKIYVLSNIFILKILIVVL